MSVRRTSIGVPPQEATKYDPDQRQVIPVALGDFRTLPGRPVGRHLFKRWTSVAIAKADWKVVIFAANSDQPTSRWRQQPPQECRASASVQTAQGGLVMICREDVANETCVHGVMCRVVRESGNKALTLRQNRYWGTGKAQSTNELNAWLPVLKNEHPWLAEVDSLTLNKQSAILAPSTILVTGRSGFPRFKSKNGRQTG
jgi:hypothetical protein